MTEKTELEILKEELERVSNAAFFMSMSDNFCYSTGRIYPLLREEKELKAKIAELESKSE